MIVFVFDDEEFVRESIMEACQECDITCRAYRTPGEAVFDEVMKSDGVICDNKFSELGYVGSDFVCDLRDRGYRGPAILYTNFPRVGDRLRVRSHYVRVVEKETPVKELIRLLLVIRGAIDYET
jgi:FixJ family two-component response regulator